MAHRIVPFLYTRDFELWLCEFSRQCLESLRLSRDTDWSTPDEVDLDTLEEFLLESERQCRSGLLRYGLYNYLWMYYTQACAIYTNLGLYNSSRGWQDDRLRELARRCTGDSERYRRYL